MSISSSERGARRSIVSRWRRNAERYSDRDAIVFWRAGQEPERWTYCSLFTRAEALASALRDAGIRPGDVCGIVLQHGLPIYPIYVAMRLAGAVPAILAHPNARIHPEKYQDGLRGMSRRSGLDWILTESQFRETIEPLVLEPGSLVRGILNVDSIEGGPRAEMDLSDSEPLLLQHSSGTTGLQKAVTLSNEAVMTHLEYYSDAIRLRETDRVASWLPLYHDMGLIAAFHLPLYHGITSIQLDPFEWVMAPVLLLQAMSEECATIVWLPNFAFNVIADRVHDDEIAELDLSEVRLIVNCSEPIRASRHRALLNKLHPAGLRSSALSACYAMAETTFAVTQTEVGTPPTTLLVDREALRQGAVQLVSATVGESGTRECVSSGVPIQGCELRVVSDSGQLLADGEVGELVVSSESMFDGYRNWPERTADVLSSGWFKTGDLGFRWNGEIFVTGRKKDLIIVAGKNIYPEDIEDTVGRVAGVIPGRVVAFGVEDGDLGTERICVAVESELRETAHPALINAIRAAGSTIDVTITEVRVVPPRWLIKSSAGKPSRSANRSRLLATAEGKF